jgi:hypothetical protein
MRFFGAGMQDGDVVPLRRLAAEERGREEGGRASLEKHVGDSKDRGVTFDDIAGSGAGGRMRLRSFVGNYIGRGFDDIAEGNAVEFDSMDALEDWKHVSAKLRGY